MSKCDVSTPVLILKTAQYPLHHGGVGIVRSLGGQGVSVYAVTEDRFTPAAVSRYLAGRFVWKQPQMARPQMLDALAAIGRKLRRPTILIPTDDFGAVLIVEESAMLREWFVFPQVPTALPGTLANKATLHALCSQIRVPSARAWLPTSLSEVHEIGELACFPVVVKPAVAWLKPNPKLSIIRTAQELIEFCRGIGFAREPNLLVQEYIPCGEDWFVHAYCNTASDCLAAFTGLKLRSFPTSGGITTLGKSITNHALLNQAEAFLKAVPYVGVVDMDYRLDKRDGLYKLLDCNPRIGAQFRLFVDENGLDIVTTLYRDLTGQPTHRSRQIDGRVFIAEPSDCRSSFHLLWRGNLSVRDWWRSFSGRKELAWFDFADPGPWVMAWLRLVLSGLAKAFRRGLPARPERFDVAPSQEPR